MITLPPFTEQLVMTPDGQMVAIGFYTSHSLGSRLHPDQFTPVTLVLCEAVEYGTDGRTLGLKLHTYEASEVMPL